MLLSGGLDSSLVSAIAVRLIKQANPNAVVKSFTVGLKGYKSPDLDAARHVADFIGRSLFSDVTQLLVRELNEYTSISGTEHHEVYFTIEEGLAALDTVMYHLESLTTIHAAVPMYFLSKAVKAENVTVVLSGEGADELFAGSVSMCEREWK